MKRAILFVDDDQNALDGFRTMMHVKRKEWGCKFALNAEEGLKLVTNETFDVVISDMRMPGMDGNDFLKEVAKLQPGAIRMIFSGYSEMEALFKSAKYAHQFLSKPSSAEKVISTIQRALELDYILTNSKIRDVVTQLESLPAIQDLYIRISRELECAEPNLKHVAKLVEGDLGISTTLLKVVNSSFFGFYERIISPGHAAVLLGVEALKGLILGVQLLDKIDLSNIPNYSINKLWGHCLQTGYFAKVIAASEGQEREFVESCFVCGILHDVGKLVLVTQMADAYRPLLESAREKGGPIIDFEMREMEVSHVEIGAYLLGLWGFQADVVGGVYGHHHPDRCGKGLTPALVVHVANSLQHELSILNSEYKFSKLNMPWIESQGLGDRLEHWRDVCKQHMG